MCFLLFISLLLNVLIDDCFVSLVSSGTCQLLSGSDNNRKHKRHHETSEVKRSWSDCYLTKIIYSDWPMRSDTSPQRGQIVHDCSLVSGDKNTRNNERQKSNETRRMKHIIVD